MRGVLSGKREDLKLVATYQKGVLICLLIYVLAVIGSLVAPPEFRSFMHLGILLVGLVGAVFVFLLTRQVYNTGLAVLLTLLMLVPLVSFVVLYAVNSKATSVLTQNGIKVGLLGANLSRI